MEVEILYDKIGMLQVEKWGKSVFAQFDSNSDGKLSKAELLSALKSLPKTKPKTMRPGAKFMSVDAMISAMDDDENDAIELEEYVLRPSLLLRSCPWCFCCSGGGSCLTAAAATAACRRCHCSPCSSFLCSCCCRWLDNLEKCEGLVSALAENVNVDGVLGDYKPAVVAAAGVGEHRWQLPIAIKPDRLVRVAGADRKAKLTEVFHAVDANGWAHVCVCMCAVPPTQQLVMCHSFWVHR